MIMKKFLILRGEINLTSSWGVNEEFLCSIIFWSAKGFLRFCHLLLTWYFWDTTLFICLGLVVTVCKMGLASRVNHIDHYKTSIFFKV